MPSYVNNQLIFNVFRHISSYQSSIDLFPRGTVLKVKVLGVFAMIDEGETDWKVKLQMYNVHLFTNTIKVMAIDVNDPLAENLNDIQDVDKIMPGFLKVRRMLCLNSP